MDSAGPSVGSDASARKRVSTACEACRATKIKCQPSEQPGICRKCLDSKRECISRTGPRTRRRKIKFVLDGPQQPEPPAAPGPSKTFTIDFDVPSQPEVDENFDTLRDTHAHFIDSLFPAEPSSDPLTTTNASSPFTSFPTPPSSTHTLSIQALHAKPQFNLDSATSLLVSFRGMLAGNFPCIVLKPTDTVPSLAASRPFVLLAILATASGSRTLQGHTLYDEEFRKVLGLKFVAGGERSLELLQGLLIYCAWYPFHLRPKNKQALQYVRMVSDLAHDLELDQEPSEPITSPNGGVTGDQLDKVRTYVSWYYAVSASVIPPESRAVAHKPRFTTAWKSLHTMSAPFTPWTATCCGILERNAGGEGDLVLAALARISGATSAASEVLREGTEQQSHLVLLGLETERLGLRQQMLPHIGRSIPVKIADFFFDLYIYGGALLKIPRVRPTSRDFTPASPARLQKCVATLKAFFAYVLTLDQSDFTSFTCNDWCKFIMGIILAVRVSFPLPECPDWDATWARNELNFDAFLGKMCNGVDLTPVSTRVDVLSAGRVVMRVVKDKYERRVAALNTPAESTPQGCPMLDGSLDQFFPVWDAGFGTNASPMSVPRTEGLGQQQMVFHDLWATMTMGWANEEPSDG